MATETTAFILAVVALASAVAILLRYKTALLGFTLLCFCLLYSSSISAFVFGYLFDLDNRWVGEEHIGVFVFMSVGLILFNIGVFIAWRPLRIPEAGFLAPGNKNSDGRLPAWVNSRFVIICLGCALAAYVMAPLVYGVPTVTALWSSFLEMLKVGVLVALVLAKTKKTIKPLLLASVVYVPLVIVQAVLTGFIGAGGLFLFQLLLVSCFWNSINLRTTLAFGFGVFLIFALAFSWLNSRAVIRTGQLSQYDVQSRPLAFVQKFQLTNPLALTPEEIQDMLLYRFDMSEILAAQYKYQPEVEPYDYGVTTISDLIAVLVPRILWPDKPTRAGGSEYVSKYTGLVWEETSVDLPYQFHFYANGGPVLVMAGLFCVGWLIAKLELGLFASALSFPRFLSMFFAAIALSGGGGRLDILLMTLIAGSVSYYLLGKVLISFRKADFQFWYRESILPSQVSKSRRRTLRVGGKRRISIRWKPRPVGESK
jgi:hypothetical protein